MVLFWFAQKNNTPSRYAIYVAMPFKFTRNPNQGPATGSLRYKRENVVCSVVAHSRLNQPQIAFSKRATSCHYVGAFSAHLPLETFELKGKHNGSRPFGVPFFETNRRYQRRPHRRDCPALPGLPSLGATAAGDLQLSKALAGPSDTRQGVCPNGEQPRRRGVPFK